MKMIEERDVLIEHEISQQGLDNQVQASGKAHLLNKYNPIVGGVRVLAFGAKPECQDGNDQARRKSVERNRVRRAHAIQHIGRQKAEDSQCKIEDLKNRSGT